MILSNLIVGFLTYHHYGESFDEFRFREYAAQSLDAYKGLFQPGSVPDLGGDDLKYYGPVYGMAVGGVIRLLGLPDAGALTGDVWHLAGLVTFQIAVVCIYLLGKRWLSRPAAFGVAILFSTQPLLWGHAFINPKDLPFMTFFLASMAAGLWMCDRLIPLEDKESRKPFSLKGAFVQSRIAWKDMPGRTKTRGIILGTLSIIIMGALMLGVGMENTLISNLVRSAYDTPASIPGRLFQMIAGQSGSVPVENYIAKAQTLFHYMKGGLVFLGILVIAWLFRSLLPWSIHLPTRKESRAFLLQLGRAFLQPTVLIAGIILGLTTSIRILGPLAGVIVGLYGLYRGGRKMAASILAYAVIAAIVMFLTWPFLWRHPVLHLIESMNVMAAFPWLGRVLFNGNYTLPAELPRSYLPVLISLQFTEPVIILFFAGLGISVYRWVNHKGGELVVMVLAWFILPLSLLILTRRPLYDNFRQILFLTPPLFLLGGLALEAVWTMIRKWPVKVALLVLLIIPSISNIIALHPYEYIYYNQFIGGVNGAFRRFELDYWMTSFREATQFVDGTVPQGSKIVSWLGAHLVKTYARADLIVEREEGNTYDLTGGYDYAVLSSRGNHDELYPDEAPIFVVTRDGAVLAVVKHLAPTSSP